jgi:hypothetical protein
LSPYIGQFRGEDILKNFLFAILLFPAVAFSCSEGEKMVNTFWKEVQERHFKLLASLITYDYQGLSSNGAITKKQDIAGLKSAPITGYVITKVKTSKSDHRLVVTYDLELIDASGSHSYHELFAYKKSGGHWKLFASSFIPFLMS